MLDELRRMALVTSGVAELTRSRAEQVVKDLVKAGDVRRDQASSVVKELLKRSEQNRKELSRFVRSEIQNQIENLGVATKRDLDRLERRVSRLEASKPGKTTARKSKSTSSGKTTAAGKRGSSKTSS